MAEKFIQKLKLAVAAKSEKKTIDKSKKRIFYEAFKKTLVEFTQASSIHGLRYTTDSDTHIFWRGVWIGIVLVLFVLANQLVSTFYGDFINNPTRVNIDSLHAKLPNVEFPAVTICGSEVLSYIAAKEFVSTLKLPKNTTNMTALTTIYQAIGMDLKVSFNENLLDDLQDLMESNRFTVPGFMSNIRQKCDEFFIKCRWRMNIIPCHKLFMASRTFFGECCSFNIKQEGVQRINYMATESGVTNGISIMLTQIIDENSISQFDSRGFQLILHKNDIFPTQINEPYLIGLGLETFIAIQPQEILCSNQVKQLSVSDRGCVFRNERPLEYFPEYDATNCQVECMINNVVQNCDCSPYFFGTAGSHKVCNFSKVPCLIENYDINYAEEGSEFFKCSCLPNCVDTTYQTSISQVPLENMPECIEPFYHDMKDKSNTTVIHIYMDSQTYTRFQRDLLSNIINLIANFGSSYGLFMGFSSISVIEIIYFSTFVLRRNYLDLLHCHIKVTAFLKVVEKPILKKVKYDINKDNSIIEIKTVDDSQFDADKKEKEVESLQIEDLMEKEFSFAIDPNYIKENETKDDDENVEDENELKFLK